jgi:hypothetical protein
MDIPPFYLPMKRPLDLFQTCFVPTMLIIIHYPHIIVKLTCFQNIQWKSCSVYNKICLL